MGYAKIGIARFLEENKLEVELQYNNLLLVFLVSFA